MKQILFVTQIISGIFLIILILLQNSKGGLGQAFGGSEFHTKRGAEQIVFRSTIVICALFLVVSIINIIVK